MCLTLRAGQSSKIGVARGCGTTRRISLAVRLIRGFRVVPGNPSPSIRTLTVPQQRTNILSRRSFGNAAIYEGEEVESGDCITEPPTADLSISRSLHSPPQPFSLRPYQNDAISAIQKAQEEGLTRIGVSSPTGSGKTTMFMNLIPLLAEKGPRRGQTLILVGRTELVDQAERSARRYLGPGWSVDVEQGKRHASGRADITIATVQSLSNVIRLKKYDPSLFSSIVVDEAHHAASKSYLRLLHYFNDGVELPDDVAPVSSEPTGHRVPIIGFSATFIRTDQLALSAVFEKIVFHREVTQLIDDGWLAPVECIVVKCDLDLDAVKVSATGDFDQVSLSTHVNTTQNNDLIVRTYKERASNRRSTLIFCIDLAHVAGLTEAFQQAGVDARSVSSKSTSLVRKETIAGFSRGEFPVLINCEILTEGTDIPEIDCVILARPTRSRTLKSQMVGRGLRLSPHTGKDKVLLVDVVDNVLKAGGIVVAPTLFGLKHYQMVPQDRSEATPEQRAENQERLPGEKDIGEVTIIDIGDPFRLRRKNRPIELMTDNAWIYCGSDRYVLDLLGEGILTIEPGRGARYDIEFLKKSDFGEEFDTLRPVAKAHELERAFETADMYAVQVMGRWAVKHLSRTASWRERPPSHSALNLLRKLQGSETKEKEDEQEIEIFGKRYLIASLNAGQVSSFICAMLNGASTQQRDKDEAEAPLDAKDRKKAEKAARLAARNLPLPPSS